MSRRKKSNGVPSEAVAEELRIALSELSFVEVLNSGVTSDRIRVLMRVHDDSSWLPVLKLILREERRQSGSEKAWSLHVCRQFMLHPDDDKKLVFAWNFILRSRDSKAAVDDLRRVIDVAKSAITIEPETPQRGRIIPTRKRSKAGVMAALRGDVREYPLMARQDRNMPEVDLFAPTGKRKGAHLIGG